LKRAVIWTALWISLAMALGAVIWATRGATDANQYFSAYLIEMALSVDNVFVFAILLRTFAIPSHLQRGLLNWGVLGALIGRAGFILAGVSVLEHFRPALYILGGFLVIAGLRMARQQEMEIDPEGNLAVRLLRRVFPGATPWLAALVAIETTDLVLAADSVPAALAVTTNTFLVFSSNALAVIGLRSLYFVVSGMMDHLRYLHVGLAVVLVFVGAKIIAADAVHIPTSASLLVIVSVILISAAASLLGRRERRERRGGRPPTDLI
jgi:tellurite resistance protein TerC